MHDDALNDSDSRTDLFDRVRRHAASRPNEVAVVDGDRSIDWGSLEASSGRLTSELVRLGVGEEDVVAIWLPRSIEFVSAWLGILESGAACLPISTADPVHRAQSLLSIGRAETIVTTHEFAHRARTMFSTCRVVESDRLDDVSLDFEPRTPRPGSLAYVMFTSGSSGAPKGVAVEWRSLSRLLAALSARFPLGPGGRVLFVAPVSFDVSITEVVFALRVGATIVVANETIAREPHELVALVERSGVDLIQATPSMWHVLLATGWRPTRDMTVLAAGEPLSRELARDLGSAGARVWNLYGPTEATVYATASSIDPEDEEIAIGFPLAGVEATILDESMRPVAPGSIGELHLGGPCLARGYIDANPDDARRFGVHEGDGRRTYRTGDLVRFVEGRGLVFCGRRDRQVKIRGHRVELSEVEAVLATDARIRACFVTAEHPNLPEARLIAHVVLRDTSLDHTVVATDLLVRLRTLLPDYLVPSFVRVRTSLPLTTSGKVDLRRLEADGVDSDRSRRAEQTRAGDTESRLAAIWRRLLRIEHVSKHDDFFEIGGQSLLAALLCLEVAKEFAVTLSVRAVVQKATLERIAREIDAASSGVVATTDDSTVGYAHRNPTRP